jgi:anaerobic magnesium-protoporphyrin IX monomethyl ester cyclase
MSRFSFEDDSFGLNQEWISRLCDQIRPMNIKFRFQANANALNEGILDKLKRAGCEGVSMGIESGSPRILKELGKNVDIGRVEEAIRMLTGRGIKINATLIIGAPGENDDSIKMTRDFLIRNKFNNNFQILFLTPYPGTPLYDYAVKNGLIKDEMGYIENLKSLGNLNVNLTQYDDKKLIGWRDYILSEVGLGNGSLPDSAVTWVRESL